jgi:hypothetical protein
MYGHISIGKKNDSELGTVGIPVELPVFRAG